MDIHKPKPVHGWRDFLSEIAVIVVGIAIAITGEQIVEWLHWRAEVSETREAVDRELAQDLGVVQTRIEEGPCIGRRLNELKVAFGMHAKGAPLDLKATLGQPQFPHIQTSVWATAISGQGAAHLPLDMKLRYASLYDSLYWFQAKTSEESEAWSHLSLFDDHDVMSDADWSSLHQWRARAEAVAQKVDANISPFDQGGRVVRPMFDQAAALGVRSKRYSFRPGSQAARSALCRPML